MPTKAPRPPPRGYSACRVTTSGTGGGSGSRRQAVKGRLRAPEEEWEDETFGGLIWGQRHDHMLERLAPVGEYYVFRVLQNDGTSQPRFIKRAETSLRSAITDLADVMSAYICMSTCYVGRRDGFSKKGASD